MREFETGATRSKEEEKLDYEAFLHPVVLECYAQYLHKHRKQDDGTIRNGDNWQKGIPLDSYMKSHARHFMEIWKIHRLMCRGFTISLEELKDSLCADIFNSMGYLFEILRGEGKL